VIRWLLGLLLLLLVASLFSGFTIVEPGEIAVVRRFGRVLPEKPGPGLYRGLPWGIDRVDRVQIERVRSVTVGFTPEASQEASLNTPEGQLLTGDHNLVNVQAVINYAVNPDEVEQFVFQQDQAAALVARTAETVLTEWLAGRTVDTVLLEGKAMRLDTGKQSLSEALVQETQRRLDQEPYRLGVLIKDARVTYLNPPEDVKEAFEEVTRAETEINKKKFDAEQAAHSRKREVEAEAFRIRSLTAAYAREKQLLAEAEASNFLKRLQQYQELKQKNPYYLNAVWWDEMSRLYSRLRANGRIDLLDHHLAGNGLDITQIPSLPNKRQ
jgi:membrane protease subunit HflK